MTESTERTLREHLQFYQSRHNALYTSIMCIPKDLWLEMKSYARPADVLLSTYNLKQELAPYNGGYYSVEDLMSFDCHEAMSVLNWYCGKWHAVFFEPNPKPQDESFFRVVDDARIRDTENAFKRFRKDWTVSETNPKPETFTFNDDKFLGRGFLHDFWQDTDIVRDRLYTMMREFGDEARVIRKRLRDAEKEQEAPDDDG